MSTAKQRLAAYRKRATDYKANHPDANHYIDWRHWMIRQKKSPSTICHDNENPKVLYVDSLDSLGWRKCGDSEDLITLRHSGWYADNDQDSLIKGTVLQLPSRHGVKQYVPATYHTDYDTCTVYLNDTGPDREQAARDADRNAEIEAEESREFYAKDAAEQQIAEAREEIHRINKETLAVLKEIKTVTLPPHMCSLFKGAVRQHLADRKAQFERIAELKDDHWNAVLR